MPDSRRQELGVRYSRFGRLDTRSAPPDAEEDLDDWLQQVTDETMSRGRKDCHVSKNRRRVLRDYRQEGKRFIPPFLQHMRLKESRWTDDRVPELVWIALLIETFGLEEGVAVAASVAKAAAKCDQTAQRAFGATSDYAELTDENKRCVRSALNAHGMLDKARRGLAALTYHYSEFPLAFLAETEEAREDDSGSTLDGLKAVIDNINDRESSARDIRSGSGGLHLLHQRQAEGAA